MARCRARFEYIKVPIYKAVAGLADGDAAGLGQQRRKLNRGNLFQAILNGIAACLMVAGLVG